ncbi:hypothetical protein [Pseudothioclava arenosa]|uniref:Uncharacterized protein n=1 Tax=Pseudothioclava arenosa TaxID=1795308 RepID=A0A2A4CSF3_9RHOB|nr:hypothetical protein [Pseudothioclava arenosa]PCD77218.1 hypothetical protein CLN94_05495 [Pseudothioclava arenosa]
MDYEKRLSSLLRERELAARKIPDLRLTDGPDKGRFWSTILSRFTKPEQQATKERWGGYLRDAFLPGPRTEDEQRISDKNRTIREIDADIAAIPPATVTLFDHTPTHLPTIEGRAVVIAGISKEPSPYAYDPRFKDKYVVTSKYHPAISDGLAEALGSRRAHRETALSIQEDARKFPCRSHASFSEEQNYDTALKAEVDGRHFRLSLILSKPMFEALIKYLPEPDRSRPYSMATRHLVYAPINYDDTPRDLPDRDPAPKIRYPSVRLTRLLVAEMSSTARDAKLVQVISLNESE